MRSLPALAPADLHLSEAPPYDRMPLYNADIQSVGFPADVIIFADAIRNPDGAVTRIAVARDYRLDPSAVRQLAQEEDVVEALLARFPSRACAGFETAGSEQGNHPCERLRRHASDFPKSRRDHHLVVNEVCAVGMTQ